MKTNARAMTFKKPNIILIILDAFRADHLSIYGYHKKTTPNIDKIASKGIVFEKAFTAAEWSPPSHASILTGKYPSFHRTLGKKIDLDKKNITIAELLKANGYHTICITANPLISPINGFDKGFDEHYVINNSNKRYRFDIDNLHIFLKTMINGPDKHTYRTNEKIMSRLSQKNIRYKPFFLFVNFFNAHGNYDPPYPYKSMFYNGFYQPRFFILNKLFKKITGKSMEKITNGMNLTKLNYLASNKGHFAFITKELLASEEEWDVVRSWYDGEICYLDHQIGRLFHFLSSNDFVENTLIILTADHGEYLGEHGLASHHFSLYDTLIHVPLIIYSPKFIPTGSRFSNIVSTIDIFPTIMDFAGIKTDVDNIQGRSLIPFENRMIHKYIISECGESIRTLNQQDFAMHPFRNKLGYIDVGCKCIRSNKYKYMEYANGKREFYDIEKDPKEEYNIISKNYLKANRIKKILEQKIDINYYGPKKFITTKESKIIEEKLRKLGYIS